MGAPTGIFQVVHIVCVTVDNLDTTCPPCKFTSPVEVDSAGHLSLKNSRMPPYHPAGCAGSTVFFSDNKVSKFGSSSTSDAIPSRTFPIHAFVGVHCSLLVCSKKTGGNITNRHQRSIVTNSIHRLTNGLLPLKNHRVQWLSIKNHCKTIGSNGCTDPKNIGTIGSHG